MRPVNLIPPEERRGEAVPLRAGVASYVIVGVLAAALFAVTALVLTGNSINDKKAELAALQARQSQAQQDAAKLAPFSTFASTSQTRQLAVHELADSRFDWDRVLNELALVLPDDIWLQSLSGSAGPGATVGAGGGDNAVDPSITGPSLHIVGCGRSQDAVAGFLAAMRDIDGVTRVGIQSSELGDEVTSDSSGDGDAAPVAAEGESSDCQTRASVARFDVTIAFDAVPASAFSPSAADGSVVAPATDTTATTPTSTTATDGTATTPSTTTTPAPTTTPTTPAPATSSDGVSDATAEQQSANDSAQTQIDKAKNGASNVGEGG